MSSAQKLIDASPQISVRLYKTISRSTVDGSTPASERYQGKAPYIDLTPFLNMGSSVRTSKSVRAPAGAFTITFSDKPHNSLGGSESSLESIYGLIEPMDMVEIRAWSGIGEWTASKDGKPLYPIKMRGFVTQVQRGQGMSENGMPQRQVVVTGHDYGKIWQMYQIIHLAAYAQGKALLTSYALNEMFGVEVKNVLSAPDFVRDTIKKIINPFIAEFMPEHTEMPRDIKTGDSISVKHGVINNSYQNSQGSIYDMMKFHGDVGIWNELYTEDREDGVHCVYRAVPYLNVGRTGNADGLIQDDAVMPPVVDIEDKFIVSISADRSDADVANFFWVNNARYDMIGDLARKRMSIPKDDSRISLREYPNSAVKYYSTRPMYAETQMSDDAITNATSGQDKQAQDKREAQQEDWIDKRLRILRESNKDNVIFEQGTATIKGGLMRPVGKEAMKAGDYANFKIGNTEYIAYVVQIDEDFRPFQSYTSTLTYERGEGFAKRIQMEGGITSPWLAEQARR